jgi:hypothetical protein
MPSTARFARRHIRHAVAGTVTAGLLATGAIAMAGPASAVGSSGCTSSNVATANYPAPSHKTLTTANGLRFRSGPGTSYSAKGQLKAWTHITLTCSAKRYSWAYGKVTSGAHKGQWGWINRNYYL